MIIKEVLDKLYSHFEYKDWKKNNPNSYLSHLFKMIDDKNDDNWQVGFYNNDNTVTTFDIKDDDIEIKENQEIFQKEKKQVHELKLDEVKIDLNQALELAKEFQRKTYNGNEAAKIMVVLQNIANHVIYNVTYITITFNTLNMKISPDTGEVISHEITPMMQFGK
jgi:hypothetical protein